MNRSRSWYQNHKLRDDYSISCAALNVGGLQKASKRIQIKDQDFDLIALCETHLQAHLELSESQQYDAYISVFGVQIPRTDITQVLEC